MKPGIDHRMLTALSIFVSMTVAFVWWMSPLGFGFAAEADRPIASIYLLSHQWGVPLLLAAQLAAVVSLALRRSRLAFYLSALSLGVFIVLVAIVLVA